MDEHSNVTRDIHNNYNNHNNHNVDLITNELLVVFLTVNLVILAGAISMFGIVSNVINILIFIKQGLNDSVNIGLLALAVSDFCSLFTLEWINILNNPLFINNVPLVVVDVQHLTAALPHASFARITSWITAYITLERCLCVVLPLRVKRIITPRVTICVILCIYVSIFLTLVPEYVSGYLDWKFIPHLNRSMLGLVFLENRDQLAGLSFNLGVGTQLSSFGAVVIFTTVLSVKFQQHSKWRRCASNSDVISSKGGNTRDRKTINMIIVVAVIYCVCFLPMLATFIATSIEPELIVFGAYNNTFFVVWSVAFLCESVNSSINIFVYHKTSTKYRTVFHLLFYKQKANPAQEITRK